MEKRCPERVSSLVYYKFLFHRVQLTQLPRCLLQVFISHSAANSITEMYLCDVDGHLIAPGNWLAKSFMSLFIALVLIFLEIVPLEDCYSPERLPVQQQVQPWGTEEHSTPSHPDHLNFK